MRESEAVSRRNFIKGGASVAALMGLASLTGCATGAAAEGTSDSTIKWDEDAEVLIVGSGYAALAAAIEAHATGAQVRIIDKRDFPGGNSMKADGDFAVCGSSAQAAQGVKDSIDDYVNDMLVAGLYLNDVEKCRAIAEKSNETWEWVTDLGVEWVKNDTGNIDLLPYGGHTNYRTMKPVGAGQSIVNALKKKVDELGIEVELGKMMTEIYRNDEGRLIGITIQDKVKNNDPTTGKPVNIKVKKALVLATGGFGGDVTWRMQHDPRLDDSL
ncbi:MAG: FAD-dependent oxidoreductase, partial [Raoultibacter sp.]